MYFVADIGFDHHLLIGKVQRRLKRTIKATPIRSIAVEKLKYREILGEFQLQISNRFGILAQIGNIEDEWQRLTNGMKECAEAVIERRRSTNKED